MADGSAIEWTHSTYPFENCFDLTLRPERIDQPKHWRRPRLGAMLCWDRNGHSYIDARFRGGTAVFVGTGVPVSCCTTKKPVARRQGLCTISPSTTTSR